MNNYQGISVLNKFKCLFIVCFLAVHTPAPAQSGFTVLHPSSVGEGEPFILEVSGDVTVEDLEVVWLDKTVSFAGQGNTGELMLAVPLATEETEIPLLVRSSQGYRVYSAMLGVDKKDFPEQSLEVDPRFVNPPESEVPRIQREAKKNRAIYAAVTRERYWKMPLRRPLPGIITSEFGVRRLFNGEPRNRHRGVDFRGAEGARIESLAAGRVVLAENQYYSGNVVIIDHGLGVYSNYCHLSAFKVKEGDMVQAGQLVGLVGMTGRVTGPHLHLGFVVLGQAVTPEPLIPDFRLPAEHKKQPAN
jgi:murein DD-endopeptidase MepM/ murein hydrolase activator NlpD